jgi:eukaryotic-like serine/threonine-protein kinase
MTLSPGAHLGPYEVLALLGAGGMGEVYKARDTRLGRTVAIKILPRAIAEDAEWRARLTREARAVSALDHPRIVSLYDICDVDGRSALVMQYVEGRTLRAVIARAPLPLKDALAYGVQLADGVWWAHTHGVVHRDLKPDNIMTADDGSVKILDFGVAKQMPTTQPADALTRTVTGVRTRDGQIIGTPAYMSPEQVRGEAVDKTADIWAFGCVLYEMLTGRQAFASQTFADTVAAILEREPDWNALPPKTPIKIRDLLRRCLRKDSTHRLQDIADARIEIEETLTSAPPRRPARASWWMAAAAGTLAVAAILAFVGARTHEPVAPLPEVSPFTTFTGREGRPVFSPDGRQVAFTWDEGAGANLFVKLVGGSDPLRLTADPGVVRAAWSPDGRQIAFLRRVKDRFDVVIVPALGGPGRRLAIVHLDASGLAWSADGRFLVTVDRKTPRDPHALVVVSTESGDMKPLTTPPASDFGDSNPVISPDGRSVAFVHGHSNPFVTDINVVPMSGGDPVTLVSRTWEITGLDWTPDGRAILYAGGPRGNARLWQVPAAGGESQLLTFGEGAQDVSVARVGQRLVYSREFSDMDIWRVSGPTAATRDAPTKLMASTQDDVVPRYSPDGRHVVFLSNRSGQFALWTCEAEGAGCRMLATMGDRLASSAEWAPDSRSVAFTRPGRVVGRPEIHVAQFEGGLARRVTDEGVAGAAPGWSPDGRWIYFTVVGEVGSPEVWPIWKVLATGGAAVATGAKGRIPRPSEDGRFLYYVKGGSPSGSLWRMDLRSGQESFVLDDNVGNFDWVLWRDTVIYARVEAGRTAAVQCDLSTGRTSELVSLGQIGAPGGLTVSPDGRWILYARADQIRSDLFLVDNIR